ncbi:MAG TPA: OmpA family protein, partial [Tissierellaceae bacterium]
QLFEGEYKGKDLAKLPSEYYYRYSQTLRAAEEYEKSESIMNQFIILENQDTRAVLYRENPNYIKNLLNNEGKYELSLLDINSSYSDYGATIYEDQLIFTSARESKQRENQKVHLWTNENFTSLYSSKINSNQFEEPILFAKEIQSNLNNSTAVFSKDGNTMFFTSNTNKLRKNKQGTYLLKIFKAIRQVDGTWSQIQELPFNSDYYNTAHPALSNDDKWLYFASDREGTIGQSDLFRVAILNEDQYGEAENLGKIINTTGRETFPYISATNNLYFASDGHPGLGGLDLFYTNIQADGGFGPVVNLGKPINSNMDDFGIYWNDHNKRGFVSSNRLGVDNIYLLEEKSCYSEISGYVYNDETNQKLNNASVTLYNAFYELVDTVQSNEFGYFNFKGIECDKKYRIKAEKEGFNTKEIVYNSDVEINKNELKISLVPIKKKITVNDDLFKMLNLNPIHFDFDKSDIKSEAASELMKIVEVLKQYPTMKIQVRSHTDSRGNSNYNLKLSDRRANATVQWLIDQGIDSDRLSAKGYGDTQLVNKCRKGVFCSPEEHAQNRRSEFIVLEL